MKTPNKLPLQLFIHTPSNDIVTFSHVSSDATICELKSQLELKTGILSELQSLYLSNVRLEDSKTFNEKKIRNGAVLRVKIKEKSLEEIYLTSIKGNIENVFKLGVEFMNDDGNDSSKEEDTENDILINQMKAWNTFVPLRAFQALFAACYSGHLPLISNLLKNGSANIGMISRNRRSVLHVAAYQGHLPCVSLLLSLGADSKLVDLEGMSPLSLAAQNCHVKVEKRIWLFNWNMDVIKGIDEQKDMTENELEIQEIRETAQRYQVQYKRTNIKESESNNNSNSLPTILTEKLFEQKEDNGWHLNPNKLKLPNLTSSTNVDQKNISKTSNNKKRKAAPMIPTTRAAPVIPTTRAAPVIPTTSRVFSQQKLTSINNLPFNVLTEKSKNAHLRSNIVIQTKPKHVSLSPKWSHGKPYTAKCSNRESISTGEMESNNKGRSHSVDVIKTNKIQNKEDSHSKTNQDEEDSHYAKTPKISIHKEQDSLYTKVLERQKQIENSQKHEKDSHLAKTSKSIVKPNDDSQYVKVLESRDIQIKNSSNQNQDSHSAKTLKSNNSKRKEDKNISLTTKTDPLPPMRTVVNQTKDETNNCFTAISVNINKLNNNNVIPIATLVNMQPKLTTVQVDCLDLEDKSAAKLKEIILTDREKVKKVNNNNQKTILREPRSLLYNSSTENNVLSTTDSPEEETTTHFPKDDKQNKDEENIDDDVEVKDQSKQLNNSLDPFVETNRFWRPESSLSLSSEPPYVFRRSGKCFEEWRKEKRKLKKQQQQQQTSNLSETKTNVGNGQEEQITVENEDEKKEKNQKAFEEWLISKAKQNRNNNFKLNPDNGNRVRTLSEKSYTFEKWLKDKQNNGRPKSAIITMQPKSNTLRNRIPRSISYKEWKDFKLQKQQRKLKEIAMIYEESFLDLQQKQKQKTNNTSYEKWLNQKDEERRIDFALQATIQAQEDEEKRLKTHYKMNNPRLKTFEEWLLEKKYDMKLKVNTHKNKNATKKYPEDSNLIFDMWLVHKFNNEMEIEKDKLSDTSKAMMYKSKHHSSLDSIRENEYIGTSNSESYTSSTETDS